VWTVPAGTLKWGQTYIWSGRIGDYNTGSPWTLGSYLTTRVPQPPITSHLSTSTQPGGGVDPGVGNYTTAITDAEVAAVGPELSVVRTYNSLDPRRGLAFGSGWATRWDTRVEPDTDGSGNVVVTYPDGRQARYGKNPDGTLAAPSGQSATLLAVTGGGWTLRTQDGGRYSFDATGRLTAINDAAGRAQNLAYDAGGKLTTATDAASGRSLTFTWTGNHVTQVRTSSSLALTWTYTYQGDRLTQVCDPTTACTSYAYGTGSHYRSITLDANPRAYWRLAEPSGTTAVSEVPGFWGAADGTASTVAFGQPGPLAGSPTTAAGFNGTSSFVRLPDNLIRNSSYAAVELWFKTTSTAGGVLFSTSYSLPGDPNPGGSMPVLYVGTDGKLHGHLWNGSIPGIVSANAVNDGTWHHVALSGAFDSQTLYLDGAAVGTAAGQIQNLDPHILVGAGAVSTLAWPARPVNNWGYFNGGIAEVALYHQPLGSTEVAEHYAARAVTDQLTSITRPGGVVAASVVYDGAADRVSQYTDGNGGTYAASLPTVEGDGFRYASGVGESSPDAYWRLSETTGTTTDGQAQFARGTYQGGAKAGGPFGSGSAGRAFDGTASYLRLPDNEVNGSTRLAVELWFKTTSTAGGVLFGTGNDLPGAANPGGSMPVLYVGTDGKLYGHFWNGNTTGIVTPNPVNNGGWHHVVLSGVDQSQTLWLDGVAVGSQSGQIQNLDPYHFVGAGASHTLNWPARPTNAWGYFNGTVSQVAVYSRGLDPAHVQANYAARTSRANYLTAVRALEPHAWWGLEDETASAQAANDPGVAIGSYQNVALAAPAAMRGAAAAGFNGTSSYVRLPNRQARGRTHLSVEMWFQTSATTGGVLYATGNDLPGTSNPGGAMPVLYVGTDGKLYGHFWNGTVAGIVTPNVVNDGQWHHVVLSGAGDTQSLYLDGNLVDSQDGQIETIDTYDFIGAGASHTLAWPARPANAWGYFTGTIGEVATYHRPLDSASVATHYSAKVAAMAVRLTDPASQTTIYTYDPTRGGRLVSTTTPSGGTSVLAYDTGGFVNRVTDENGHATTLVNDARGNPLSRTACRTAGTEACHTSYRTYYLNTNDPLDPRNDRVTEFRDARSTSPTDNTFLTSYTYTPTGDIATVATPGATTGAQRTTTYAYTAGTEPAIGGGTQPAGLPKSVTNPANGITGYAYTSAGDLARVTDPAGLITDFGFDGIGRTTSRTITSTTLPGGATTTFAYDGMSRLTQQVDPATTNAVTQTPHQQRTTRVYNPNGTLASSTVDDVAGVDPARTTGYTYDTRGRVATVTDPAGGVTQTEYDAFGAVTRTVNPAGTEFTATYTLPRHQPATVTVKGFTGDGAPARDVVLESRAYDPAGRLANVTDAMGRTTAYTYYDDNLPASETLTGYLDPVTGLPRDVLLAGYAYTGTGAPSTVTRGEGRYSTATVYDPGGRPTNQTDRDGTTVLRSVDTTFDVVDNPIRVIGRNADASVHSDIETGYDPLGREISRTVHTGTEDLVTTTSRDERGLALSTVDPRGTLAGGDPAAFTTSYGYDPLGRTTTVTAPPVAVESGGQPATITRPITLTGYNTYGDTVDVRDPNDNITHTGHDPAGRPITVTLPAYTPPGASQPITATTTTEYDPAGRVTALVDALNQRTTFTYDQLGNQRTRTDPPAPAGQAGGTWSATFDPLGEQLSTTDPNGAQTFATYDQLGRTITSTVVERVPTPTRNLTTRYRYDALSNIERITSPSGKVASFTHDDLGNPLTVTNGVGKTVTTGYDGAGRPVSVTDPLSNTRVQGYDLAGRVTIQSDKDLAGVVLRTRGFAYDRADNQTSATDSLSVTTTASFNAHNQLTSLTRPVSATASITTGYGYDAAGNVTRATDGNNHTTVFTANVWNLPESTVEPATAQTPNEADRTYMVAYDAAGRTATLTKPGGVTITTAYDPQGNVVVQSGTGAAVTTPNRTFTYDPAGRLTGASAPGGSNTFGHDDRGNLVSATGPSGTSSYTINDDNQQVTATTPAGTASFTYDAAGRLATATDPITGVTSGYGYDDASRVTSVGYGTGNGSRSYGWDALGRMTSDTSKNPAGATTASMAYGYDTEDRLTSKTTTGVAGATANTYGYDQAGRLVSWNNGSTTTDYEWDAAGNRTRDGPDTAVFNERNQLLALGGTTYTYTPRGTLASRTTGGATTNLAFNAFDELVTDGARNYSYDSLNRLVSAGSTSLAYAGTGLDVTSDGSAAYSYTPDGNPLGVNHGGTTGLAVTDLHTDLTGVLNPATGGLAGSRTYTPFGEGVASAGVQPGLGFQHQYTDPGTGNVNMGSRWYQPSTGGFASRDTIPLDPRDVTNANRHAYAAANPLTNTDPTGHVIPIAIPIIWGVAQGLGWVMAGAGALLVAEDIRNRVNAPSRPSARPAPPPAPRFPRVPWLPSLFDGLGISQGPGGPGPAPWVGPSPGPRPSPGPGGGTRYYGGGGSGHSTGPGRRRGLSPAEQLAAARAAAEAARLAALRERIRRDALTPHARPASTPTIAPGIQQTIDAANNQSPVNLGTLTPPSAEEHNQPYTPTAIGPEYVRPVGPTTPAPAQGHIYGACFTGYYMRSDGTRSSQIDECDPPAGGAAEDFSLRHAYRADVEALKDKGAFMLGYGLPEEFVARTLHAERRALGEKYKDLTPQPLRARIAWRNVGRYQDPLGPSIDWLRDHGKSWLDIIDSAARSDGRDLGLGKGQV
jgi:RHS repeat-associated protein